MGLNKQNVESLNVNSNTENSRISIKSNDDFSSKFKAFIDTIIFIATDILKCFTIGIETIIESLSNSNSSKEDFTNAYSGLYKKEVKPPSELENQFNDLFKKTAFYQARQQALLKEKMAFNEILNSEVGTFRSSVPVTYKYKVRDEHGRVIQDTFIGVSMADCNAFLLNEGYEVISIKTSKLIEFLYGPSSIGATKLKVKDLIFWLTQLSTYLKSGIPLTDAMRILAKQMGKDKRKKKIFDLIIYELTLGQSFSQALAKQGSTFPPLLINMLKAAEATGELEETLDDMANYYEEIDKTRRQMISALSYPAIVMIFAIGVVTFILLYVVPSFTKIYSSSGITMAGLTLFVVNTATFLKNHGIQLLFVVILVIIGIYFLYKYIKPVRYNIQVFLMHIPVVKDIIIYNELTIFTKTFASLLKNNVFITESIDILSKITENEVYKSIMFETINNIARGEKISESFKDHWAVPDVAYYMIVTGESTGELAQMMERVSVYYQTLHSNIVTTLKNFIEPIMIAGLAVIVGGVVLAVVIPMFDMYGQISM